MPQQHQPLPPVYNQPPQGPGGFNPGGWTPQPWAPPGQQPPSGGGGTLPVNVFSNRPQVGENPGVSTGAAAEGGPGGANVGRAGNPGYGMPGLGANTMTGPMLPASHFGAGVNIPDWATPSAGTVGGLAGSAVAGPVGGLLGNYFASRLTGSDSWTTRAADTLTGGGNGPTGGGESWWAKLMASFNREQQEH